MQMVFLGDPRIALVERALIFLKMEKNHMKPFTTNSTENVRVALLFQCGGVNREQLRKMIIGSCITAYSMPKNHSFESAWLFRLIFNNQYLVEFSSDCTEVTGWQEMGSLNLLAVLDVNLEQKNEVFLVAETSNFAVENMECLVYRDADVYAECGLVFYSSLGEEIIIAAGVSPGSVSIQAPFSTQKFQPEFAVSDYHREIFV